MKTDTSTKDPRRDDESQHRLSRRTALGLLGLGSIGVLTGSAIAQPPGNGQGNAGGPIYTWSQPVDANQQPLSDLGALTMHDDAVAITEFVGANLSVQEGVLNADVWSTDVDAGGHSITNAGAIEADSLSVATVGASVYASTTAEYFGGGTTIAFDTVEFDHRDEFDPTKHEFVAATDGYYQVSASAAVAPPGVGDVVRINLRVNGSIQAVNVEQFAADQFIDASVGKLLELAAGDVVTASLGITSNAPNEYAGGRNNTWMTIHKVA